MTTRDRALVLAACAFCASVAACSLLVSTSGLATTESAGDAGLDVAVTPSTDAARDANGATDAAGCDAGFCACTGASHTFCDDFDTAPRGASWMVSQYGPSAITYDKDGTFSPPFGVLATSDAIMNNNLRATIDSIEMPTVKRLRVELDMLIEQSADPSGMNGTHGFCPIVILMQPGDQVIRLNIYANSADVEQLSNTNSVADQPVDVPTGTGTRARYGLWLDTKARTCGVTVDGVEKMSGCVLDPALKGGAASVALGINFVRPPTEAWRIRMDNVTADYE